MMLQNPTTLAQKLQRVCQNCSNRQINHSKMQHNGVPAMWLDLLWRSACCILLHALILSETDFVSQAYLDSFLTMTNNQILKQTHLPWRNMCRMPSSLDPKIVSNLTIYLVLHGANAKALGKEDAFLLAKFQQCHPTSSCRVVPTCQGNDE